MRMINAGNVAPGNIFFIISWNNDILHIIICDRLLRYLIFSYHCSSNCFIILSFTFVSSYIFYIYRDIFLWKKRRKGVEIGERARKRRSKNERKKRELMILIKIILSPREDCFVQLIIIYFVVLFHSMNKQREKEAKGKE